MYKTEYREFRLKLDFPTFREKVYRFNILPALKIFKQVWVGSNIACQISRTTETRDSILSNIQLILTCQSSEVEERVRFYLNRNSEKAHLWNKGIILINQVATTFLHRTLTCMKFSIDISDFQASKRTSMNNTTHQVAA